MLLLTGRRREAAPCARLCFNSCQARKVTTQRLRVASPSCMGKKRARACLPSVASCAPLLGRKSELQRAPPHHSSPQNLFRFQTVKLDSSTGSSTRADVNVHTAQGGGCPRKLVQAVHRRLQLTSSRIGVDRGNHVQCGTNRLCPRTLPCCAKCAQLNDARRR